MATDKQVGMEQNEFDEPTEADKELVGFVVDDQEDEWEPVDIISGV